MESSQWENSNNLALCRGFSVLYRKNSLKLPKSQREAINRRTNNTRDIIKDRQ